MSAPADYAARQRALTPDASFIVQAPAGSGKTGLLTQRFLVLLAGVDAPEEIVAITFTRKAAAEMRQRILQSLLRAQNPQPPEKEYEQQTWALARRALARDQAQGWSLLQNPSRLRIQTIDSLCATLVQQMPVLSGLGVMPAISDDADALYRQAAAEVLKDLDGEQPWSDAVAHLVSHLDNQLPRLQELLASMLARREQWLPLLADPGHPDLARARLEAAFAHLVEDALRQTEQALQDVLDDQGLDELLHLARFAASHVDADQAPAIASLQGIRRLPAATVDSRQQWLGFAEMLLTGGGSWRKAPNARQGFPAQSAAADRDEKVLYKEMKQAITGLLSQLAEADTLRTTLHGLQNLPPHHYDDCDWQTLQALIQVLHIASGYLQMVFAQSGQIDFAALSHSALEALGDEGSPTDLALALDYRIRHLLVDEFQDTSLGQYELLKRLTAGWQAGDGRSLFVVGDPMQSIYRFRQAEVGLFIDACKYGIGDVPLEPLRLAVNFRSRQGIVDWINASFPHIMPAHNDASASAVAYAPSTAFHPPLAGEAVQFHASLEDDRAAEAEAVVALVRQSRQQDPDDSIAVIVRNRSHLADIIPRLQTAGIAYQAVEIEQLGHRPVVQDLLALSRALLQLADRVAWLALLRAPFCGLSLADLHQLVADDHETPVSELLQQSQRTQSLSEDGRARLARVLPPLQQTLAQTQRASLRRQVEGLWLALGGPACVTSVTDLDDAEVYFQLLDRLEAGQDAVDAQALEAGLVKLFALPDVKADGRLQLLTIHKSKGLEYDTVILPGLGRRPRNEGSQLLHWLERRHDNGTDLLLAPIGAHGEERNPMVASLQALEKNRSLYEDTRLLYVAATRAKKHLHLFAHARVSENREGRSLVVESRSLLGRLWPVVAGLFENRLADYTPAPEEASTGDAAGLPAVVLRRLPASWQLPELPAAVTTGVAPVTAEDSALLEFDWAGEAARHIGTVVHRLLQHLGEQAGADTDTESLRCLQQRGRQMLIKTGLPQDYIDSAAERVAQALSATLEDEHGCWLLGREHKAIENEKAITAVIGGQLRHMVIDRTFIDSEGVRWIIDYKTGSHTGGGVDEFLDRELERYRNQLETYAAAIRMTEDRPIKLGLYYPLLKGWRQWDYADPGSNMA